MQRPPRSSKRFRSIAAPIAARDHHAERERLFSAAVESSNDAIITTSLDGTITGWNSAAERLFGYSAAEAAGKNITLHRTRRPAAGGAGRAAPDRLGRKHRAQRNGAAAKRTASRIEVSLSISPIKSPSGATIGISKVARDITEANKTRQVLRQQTEELRRIFETSQDLIMVMDARGFLVQISPSCEAILGYRPEEMIGRSGDRLHSSRPSREIAARKCARRGAGSARRFPIRAAFTRTGGRCGCHGSEHGPSRSSASSSSAAT